MYYKQRRQAFYSQNFFRNPKLVNKLIRSSSIGKNDAVIEIGPGKGIITAELLKVADKVIAVELDAKLYFHLNDRFSGVKNLKLVNVDFLKFELPSCPYKVFANIPFIITTDIIRKLTSDRNFQEGYLVVQKEAARKFIGKPIDPRNQMVAVLLKPWFEIDIFWKFSRYDFVPMPRVDVLMIKIKRRKDSLIAKQYLPMFRNYIVYSYNHFMYSRMDFRKILNLFNDYLRNTSLEKKRFINSEARKIIKSQKTMQKIHRTRTDKNWIKS